MADLIRSLRRFFGELKRRKVYTVAAIYLIASAGSMQLVDAIVPSTRLPEWSDELFLAILLLGFPIALVLAWAFEVGPGGVRLTDPAPDPSYGPRSETRNYGVVESLRETAPASSADAPGSSARGEHPEDAILAEDQPASLRDDTTWYEPTHLSARHVAVLPFDVLSGTEDARPLAMGLHDDLLTELSRIPGLTVISRTSVKGYSDTRKSVREIARELRVGTLVEGGVQSAGGRVRLNIQLIDARRDVHRWAETYDRVLSAESIFDIQSELARKIAGSLRVELTAEEEARLLGRATTADLDAFRLTALGREQLDRRTEGGMRRAVDYFREALGRDFKYVLAWVGLADAYGLLLSYGHDEEAAAVERAEEAINRALELDAESAEAHASLGFVAYLRQRGPGALQALQRAIELRPGYAEAHNWLAWVAILLGLRDAALESAMRAVELDPRSVEPASNLCGAYLMNARPDEALGEAQRIRRLEPTWTSGAYLEAMALFSLGRPDESIKLLTDLHVPWTGSGLEASIGVLHAAAGDAARARAILNGLDDRADPFAVGLIYASLGEREAAFESFGREEEWSDWPSMALHSLFPGLWRELQDDLRYPNLVRAAQRAWGFEADGDE